MGVGVSNSAPAPSEVQTTSKPGAATPPAPAALYQSRLQRKPLVALTGLCGHNHPGGCVDSQMTDSGSPTSACR